VVHLIVPVLFIAGGCTATPDPTGSVPGSASSVPGTSGTSGAASPGTAPTGARQPFPAGHAPTRQYPVGTEELALTRGDRDLPSIVWYPALRSGTGVPAATGTFPLILFSHGFNGSPRNYTTLLRRWAAAGFVVVAPSYPHTRHGAAELDLTDVANQPADASAVLTDVLRPGRLQAAVDPRRVAAAGHSAGGITTLLLFGTSRDTRLATGVVLSGTAVGQETTPRGEPAWLLFVHGDADPLVPYRGGLTAYRADPWPKALLTLPGQGHSDPFMNPDDLAFDEVTATTRDFLRFALYGDRDSGQRLSGDALPAGRLESDLPGSG
jgi:fermentation-respiration switch protein FrsA (DUF1100 family)